MKIKPKVRRREFASDCRQLFNENLPRERAGGEKLKNFRPRADRMSQPSPALPWGVAQKGALAAGVLCAA